MIDPMFWQNRHMSEISIHARYLFIGLWSAADDYGVLVADPHWIKSSVFPRDRRVKESDVQKWLDELEGDELLLFTHNGDKYYLIKNFHIYQRIKNPAKRRLPCPPSDILEVSNKNYKTLEIPPDEVEVEVEVISRKEGEPAAKKSAYAESVHLFPEEHQKLVERFGDRGTRTRIENLSYYKLSKGVKYKSDYHTILNWARKEEASPLAGSHVHIERGETDEELAAIAQRLEQEGA